MAFDVDRETLVVFGGHGLDGIFGDTWEWSIATGWKELHPAKVPAARQVGAMVYDQNRHAVFLYGGIDTPGGAILCGVDVGNRPCSADTWTWDGSSWNQFHPPMSPWPFFPSAAYDGATGNVVLRASGSTVCAESACIEGTSTDYTWV